VRGSGSHKLPLRGYLAAIAVFCNEVKGKGALALSRDLGLSYKSAFVLLHKLREAMVEEMRGRVVGGEGKTAEVDGGYFGGYIKPANQYINKKMPTYLLSKVRDGQLTAPAATAALEAFTPKRIAPPPIRPQRF
jgi:hypothetical protein